MNRITLLIDDASMDERFKTYLKSKAVKYLPFHILQSAVFLVIVFIVSGFTIRLVLSSLYFICSVIGFLIARRHLWTVPYSAIFLTEFAIINAFVAFELSDDGIHSENDFATTLLCVKIGFQILFF